MRSAITIGCFLVASVAHAQDAGTPPNCAVIVPGSADAEVCAERAFRDAEARAEFTQLEFHVAPWGMYPGPTHYPSITEIVEHIQLSSRLAQDAATAYEPVRRWMRPRWTILALIGQGNVYERLVRAITNGVTSGDARFDTRVHEAMAPQIAPIECLAIVRYLLAVRVARVSWTRSSEITATLEQLGRYGPDRIGQCVIDQRAHDTSLEPFTPRDLEPLP